MPRTIAKDHDDKRQHILDSAARCFAANSYDGASMAQIAKACGISKANIYHYYDSKEAILFDMLEAYLRVLRDRVCGVDRVGAPSDQLRRVVGEVLDVYRGQDDVHRAQLNNIPDLPSEQREVLEGYQREMVRHLSAILREMAPDRLGDDKAKLRSVAMSVFAMLNWYFMWNSGAGVDARVAYADLVAGLVTGGIDAV